AAQAIVAPGHGRVRALAQNLRYGFNDEKAGTTSINMSVDQADGGSTGFQAGSTFTVYALAAALESGSGYGTSCDAPKEMSVSGRRTCEGGTTSPWSVRNAAESDEGTPSMSSATKGAVNCCGAQLQRRVGLC